MSPSYPLLQRPRRQRSCGCFILLLLVLLLFALLVPFGHGSAEHTGRTDRSRNEAMVPNWTTGTWWEYHSEMTIVLKMDDQSTLDVEVVADQRMDVTGTTAINLAEETYTVYSVSFENDVEMTAEGDTSLDLTGTSTGTYYYDVESLELLKTDSHMDASGTGSQGGMSSGITLTTDLTSSMTVPGNTFDFPLRSGESWSAAPTLVEEYETELDYSNIFVQDEYSDTTTTENRDYSTIRHNGTVTQTTPAATFDAAEVYAPVTWERTTVDHLDNDATSVETGEGYELRYFAAEAGNVVYARFCDLYYEGNKVTTGYLELTDYDYTPPSYGLTLTSAAGERVARPGETIDVPLELTNTGTLEDTFTLSVLDNGTGWATLGVAEQSFTLGADQTTEVLVAVEIPHDAVSGTYPDYLRAVSAANPDTSAVVAIETVVNLPPTLTGFQPNASYIDIDINETIEFGVDISDPENDPLHFVWYRDETPVGGDQDRYLYEPVDAGHDTVSVHISDPYHELSHAWEVSVAVGERHAPEIVDYHPTTKAIELAEPTALQFSISARDADTRDNLSVQWLLDGIEQARHTGHAPEMTDNFTLETATFEYETIYMLRVNVSDGEFADHITWSVRIHEPSNLVLESWTPPIDALNIRRKEEVRFVVEATNEQFPIDYQWYVNDAKIYNATATAFLFSTAYEGSYIVMVNISSRGTVLRHRWNVTVGTGAQFPLSIESYAPDAEDQYIAETERMTFEATARDTSPESSPTIRWFLDDMQVEARRRENRTTGEHHRMITTQYRYNASYNASGTHRIKVVFEEAGYSVFHSWRLEVEDVNQPPQIFDPRPALDPRIMTTGKVELEIAVDDPDGDENHQFQWYVDDEPRWEGPSKSFTFYPRSPGNHNVTVVVIDGEFQDEHTWHVNVTTPSEVVVEDSRGDLFGIPSERVDFYILIFGLCIIGVTLGAQWNFSRRKPKISIATLQQNLFPWTIEEDENEHAGNQPPDTDHAPPRSPRQHDPSTTYRSRASGADPQHPYTRHNAAQRAADTDEYDDGRYHYDNDHDHDHDFDYDHGYGYDYDDDFAYDHGYRSTHGHADSDERESTEILHEAYGGADQREAPAIIELGPVTKTDSSDDAEPRTYAADHTSAASLPLDDHRNALGAEIAHDGWDGADDRGDWDDWDDWDDQDDRDSHEQDNGASTVADGPESESIEFEEEEIPLVKETKQEAPLQYEESVVLDEKHYADEWPWPWDEEIITTESLEPTAHHAEFDAKDGKSTKLGEWEEIDPDELTVGDTSLLDRRTNNEERRTDVDDSGRQADAPQQESETDRNTVGNTVGNTDANTHRAVETDDRRSYTERRE